MKLDSSAAALAAANVLFATCAAAQSIAQTRAEVFDVGAPTAGAILSGENFEVAPSWTLTVPVAGHWSAEGEDLNDKPVTPHEWVPQTRADICAGRDRGAERAMAIVTAESG
jgi:C-terminal processing protease CtpA/Prc